MKVKIRSIAFCLALFVLSMLGPVSQAVVAEPERGDVNADGFINASDALMALQHSVRVVTLEGESRERADVDSNDQVDASDALLILQFSVGLIAGFFSEDYETPCVIRTVYPTDDVVVADVVANYNTFRVDRFGREDSTDGLQTALNYCASIGGGTVFLPVGRYRVTEPIVVPSFVTLRGDWQDPDAGHDYGTIILADVESSQADTPALFTIGGSAGVMGLTVYYPKQDINQVKPYPYTFYVDGKGDHFMLQTIQNCTVINGYKGIGACVAENNSHEMMTIDTVKGTFLYRGATAYNQSDVGTWKNLILSNRYWAETGAGLAPAQREKIDQYTRAHGVGLALGDLEWTQFNRLVVSDYGVGIHIVPGKRIQFAGCLYDVSVTDCGKGLVADELDPRWGMVIANSRIEADEYAVDNHSSGMIKMTDVTLKGETSGIVVEDFSEADLWPSEESPEPSAVDLPELDYSRTAPKPAAVFYPVEADRTGKTDASAALQTALDLAEKTGGVVYLPAGHYRLDSPVTVPAGVELRGCSSVPTRDQGGNSGGTLILAYYGQTGQNDTARALVTLAGENAGVRGIRFLYPENSPVIPDRLGTCLPYAYTIRGQAKGVYAVNVGLAGAYYGIDFRGCDDHYIKKLISCCYANTITAGDCTGGWIEGCLQNGTVLSRIGLDSPVTVRVNEGEQLFPYVFDAITRPGTKLIRLENAVDETVFATFAYGVNSLIVSQNSRAFVCNVGADNLGGTMLEMMGGSFTGVNCLRWNGASYQNNGGALTLCNRLTIGDMWEPNLFDGPQ